MKRALALMVLIAAGLALANMAFAGFDRVDLQVAGKISTVIPADVDGNGKNDLVVSYAKGSAPQATPFVAVFLARANGYGAQPDFTFSLPLDSCLIEPADIGQTGRSDLVVFRKRKVVSTALEPSSERIWRTLLDRGSDLMFPAVTGTVPSVDLVRDWLGEGKVAVAMPVYGHTLFFQPDPKGDLAPAGRVRLRVNGWMSVRGPATDNTPGTSLHAGAETPKLFLIRKQDGGRELVATFREEIWQHALRDGRFEETGKHRSFSILTDKERRDDNMMMTSVVDDLNGDGLADLMINKYGGSLTRFKSGVYLFAGGADGPADTPAYTLERDGFVSLLRFQDLNDDGYKEMILPTVDIGLFQIARMLTSQSMKIKVSVYRGGAGYYGKEPELSRQLTLKVATEAGIQIMGYPPDFSGDFDGDGKPDLFMAHDDGIGVWRNTGDLAFDRNPMIVGKVETAESYRLVDLNGDTRCDFLSWYRMDPSKLGRIVLLINTP